MKTSKIYFVTNRSSHITTNKNDVGNQIVSTGVNKSKSSSFKVLSDPTATTTTSNKLSNNLVEQPKKTNKTITLLSDSHGRKLDEILYKQCGESIQIKSIVKPGAPLKIL